MSTRHLGWDCVSIDCPACVYDELYNDIGMSILKLIAWLESPHAEKDLEDKANVVRLKEELEQSQKRMAKAFLGS